MKYLLLIMLFCFSVSSQAKDVIHFASHSDTAPLTDNLSKGLFVERIKELNIERKFWLQLAKECADTLSTQSEPDPALIEKMFVCLDIAQRYTQSANVKISIKGMKKLSYYDVIQTGGKFELVKTAKMPEIVDIADEEKITQDSLE